MIKYADNSLAPQVRNMWKTVFDDPDAYMDVYFRDKYRNENTLVYIENDKAVASLQMLPHAFTFAEKKSPQLSFGSLHAAPIPWQRYMSALLETVFS